MGHDPEGLASTLGALATFLAGFAAARLHHRLRAWPVPARAGGLLALAAAWAVALPLFLLLQPVGKRLWTPSFVAVHAAAGIAALPLAVLLFDAPLRNRLLRGLRTAVVWPLVALGRNALVLWIGVFVVGKVLATTPVAGGPLGKHLLATRGPVGYFALTAGAGSSWPA